MAYRDPELGRARGRERFRRRTAERLARGLCPKCGRAPPEPDRSLCAACNEKRRIAERARRAKRLAAGKPRYKNPEKARATERERYRLRTAERLARGLCPKCGRAPLEPERRLCAPCGEKRRESERARYAAAKAAGEIYGGRDANRCRRIARKRSRRRLHARRDAGRCTRCGRRPAVEGSTVCEPCRDARRTAEREQYGARRAAGLCGRCGQGAFGGDWLCVRCAARDDRRGPRKNAAARERYARRRAKWRCTGCGEPSRGSSRCERCARRSYVRSGQHRGLPVWAPSYTVFEIATGDELDTCDSLEEVALCLAFARLSEEDVEIVSDASVMATFTSPEAWAPRRPNA
ncbi:hypothetical protein [Candidatus Rariloculus sp.]|uniref:hypothetical protein n=1 Tax=Candidatus Rariloculus sp. TaxID=3101265 RepID=UPI003D0E4ED7